MKFVLLNVIKLRTRNLYRVIDEAFSWDGRINLLDFPKAHKEVLFWRDNINLLNNRSIIRSPAKFAIYSDASDSGLGVVLKENSCLNICHRMFDSNERDRSSTWRELEAIRFGLDAFHSKLSNSCISWMTDNRAAMYVSSSGSKMQHLHDLALDIYDLTRKHNVELDVSWVPRDDNQLADHISKIVDPDDWEITEYFLEFLEEKWGSFTIDRFASFDNSKCERFNSKFAVPGTEAIDAFTQDWRFEHNLLVPPVKHIVRVLNLIRSIPDIRAVLVVPLWTSVSFWPLLRSGENSHIL